MLNAPGLGLTGLIVPAADSLGSLLLLAALLALLLLLDAYLVAVARRGDAPGTLASVADTLRTWRSVCRAQLRGRATRRPRALPSVPQGQTCRPRDARPRPDRQEASAGRLERPLMPWRRHLGLDTAPVFAKFALGLHTVARWVTPFGAATILACGFLLSLQELGQGLEYLPALPLTAEEWEARRSLAAAIVAGALQPAVYGVLFCGLLVLLRDPARRLAASAGS